MWWALVRREVPVAETLYSQPTVHFAGLTAHDSMHTFATVRDAGQCSWPAPHLSFVRPPGPPPPSHYHKLLWIHP